MTKRILLAILAVYVTWSGMDFVIHGMILGPAYEATAQLWRPMEEMKMGLIRLTVLVSTGVFVCIYGFLVADKGMATAVKYGLLFGLGAGFSMGYGSYAVMPIPYTIAFTWFAGTLAEATAGGVLLGLIVKKPAPVE